MLYFKVFPTSTKLKNISFIEEPIWAKALLEKPISFYFKTSPTPPETKNSDFT